MPKALIVAPNEEQIQFYKQIFDEAVYSKAKSDIESLLSTAKSYYDLMYSLRQTFGYDNVEDVDHYHNNKYFVPDYKSTEPDSCDFLMIGVWVDFKKKIVGMEDISTSANITLIWNDYQPYRWIHEVKIFFSKSNAHFMKPLCVTDISGTKILNWKWKNKLPNKEIDPKAKRYTEDSHILSIEELKQFVSFLIFDERIPCLIHAFERFGDIIHPKTGRPFFNGPKATTYTRLLDEGYTVYVKLHRKASYNSFILSLQREIKKNKIYGR